MNETMPSKGLHGFLVFVGFLCGVLWGALAIGPFNKMSAAIKAGEVYEAQEQAKKVKTFVFIGLGLNLLILLVNVMR